MFPLWTSLINSLKVCKCLLKVSAVSSSSVNSVVLKKLHRLASRYAFICKCSCHICTDLKYPEDVCRIDLPTFVLFCSGF